MTHIFTVLTVGLSIFISGSIGKDTTNEYVQESAVKERDKEKMPRFSYYTLAGKKFSNRDLEANKTYLFVYFNPLCDLCREEIGEIVENIDQLENVQILLVSPNHLNEINEFKDYFNLGDYRQITILHDTDDRFYLEFGAIGYPNMYIYNNRQELVRYFDHATGFSEINNALKPVLTRK